ncbi:MAG: hypothetical protein Q9214_003272 [Letrouitia sp. 1 TL-2023]
MALRPLYATAAPSSQVSPLPSTISFSSSTTLTKLLSPERKGDEPEQIRNGATVALAKTVELYRLYGAQGWTISLTVHGAIWLLLNVRIETNIGDKFKATTPALISRKPTWPDDPVRFPVAFHNGIAAFSGRRRTGNREQTNILVQGLRGHLHEVETAPPALLPYRSSRRLRLGVHYSMTSLFLVVATHDYKEGLVAFLKKVIELYEMYGAQSWHIHLMIGRQVWFLISVAIEAPSLPTLGLPEITRRVDEYDVNKPAWPGTDIYFTLASVPRARLHFFHNLASGTQTQLEALIAGLREYRIELAMAEQPPIAFQKTKDCGHGVKYNLRDQFPAGVSGRWQKIGLMAMLMEVIQLYERHGAQGWGIMLQVNHQNWFLLTVVIHLISLSSLTSRQEKCDLEKPAGLLNINIEENATHGLEAHKITKPTWPGTELAYQLQGIPRTSNTVAHFFWPGRDGGKNQLDAFQGCMRAILSDVESRRAPDRFQIVRGCGSSVYVSMHDWLVSIPFARKKAGVIALIRKITALYENYGPQQWHISLDVFNSRWITVFVRIERYGIEEIAMHRTDSCIIHRGLDKPTMFGGSNESRNLGKPSWPRYPAFVVRGYPGSALLFSMPGREGNKDQLTAFNTGVSSFLHTLRSESLSILTISKDCGRGVLYKFDERDMYPTRQQGTLAAIAMLQEVIALYSQYGVKGWKIWMIVDHVLKFSMEVTVRPLTLVDRDVTKSTWPGSEFTVESLPGAQLFFSNPQRTGNSVQNGALIACMKSFVFLLSVRSSPGLDKMMNCGFGTSFSFDDLRPVRETYEENRMAAVAMLKTLVVLYERYGAQSWDVRLRLQEKTWFMMLISIEAYPVVAPVALVDHR